MRVVVYTAAFGQTDAIRMPEVVRCAVEYVAFTDQPTVPPPYVALRSLATSQPPHLVARRIKILAEPRVVQEADIAIWHDASYRLTVDPLDLVAALGEADLAVLPHRRTRLADEAAAIARYGYVTPAQGAAHVARYEAEGFSPTVLSTAGLLVRRMHDGTRAFAARWWQEVQQWGGRDQGSVDYAAWACGLTVRHLDGTVRSNRYAQWREPVEVKA